MGKVKVDVKAEDDGNIIYSCNNKYYSLGLKNHSIGEASAAYLEILTEYDKCIVEQHGIAELPTIHTYEIEL